MRGHAEPQAWMFSFSPESRVPPLHPLRSIKAYADELLRGLSRQFEQMYAKTGRPSIPPERLLKATLLNERLAAELSEPGGTLVLTLAITCIEVMIIVSTMSAGEGTPTLARDAMFAVIMIVLNGMVGLTLILGALKPPAEE